MRISISGTGNSGKSTLIQDFLKKWPMYKTPSTTYRDKIKAGGFPHSKKCNKEGQWAILNHMIDELQNYTVNDNVIFDRCTLDNLVYSLWSDTKSATDIDESFISKCIPIVKESMRCLDIIFFTPLTKAAPIPIIDNNTREIDPEYIAEIDNIFKAIIMHHTHSLTVDKFFPKNDSPGIIEVYGSREQRIAMISQYLNVDGKIIGDEGGSVLNPHNIQALEQLVNDQLGAVHSEQIEKEQRVLVDDFLAKQRNNK